MAKPNSRKNDKEGFYGKDELERQIKVKSNE